MNKRLGGLLSCLVVALSTNLLAQEKNPSDAEAKAIVRNVVKAYRNINSYEASGVVVNTQTGKSGTKEDSVPFTISFKRPDLLRVEWTQRMPTGNQGRSALVSDGEDVTLWMETGNTYLKLEDLNMGIAAASGVSHMSANTIPSLLLEAAAGGSKEFLVLKNLVLLEDEVFEGIRCNVLSATDVIGKSVKYWIGSEDYLIRKIEHHEDSIYQSNLRVLQTLERIGDAPVRESFRKSLEESQKEEDASRTDQQIHRDIRINQNIPPETFQFVLPEGSTERSLRPRDHAE